VTTKFDPAYLFDKAVQVASYLAVIFIVVISLVPGDARPHTGAPGQGEHLIAYFLTGVLFGLRGTSRGNLLFIALAFVIGAGVLETAQTWVPGRNSQFGDFVASSAGTLAGVAAGAMLRPVYLRTLRLLSKQFGFMRGK
jgi:hypothetical protein